MSEYDSSPASRFDILFGMRSNLPSAQEMTREDAFRVLDKVGVEAIMERIASGSLPNEIAIGYRVPSIYMDEWLEARVPAELLDRARKLAAQSYALKSILPLLADYQDRNAVAMAKHLSDRMAWVAERLDPATWGPPRAPKEVAPPVTIVFEGMGQGDSPSLVIDMEAIEEKPDKRDVVDVLSDLGEVVVIEDEGDDG